MISETRKCLLDGQQRIKRIRARLESKNVTLQLTSDQNAIPVAQTHNGKDFTIVLPAPLLSWTDVEWDLHEAATEHELGHLEPDSIGAFKVMPEGGLNSPLGYALNVVEDWWQEHKASGEYVGRDQVMSRVTRRLVEKRFSDPSMLEAYYSTKFDDAVASGEITKEEAARLHLPWVMSMFYDDIYPDMVGWSNKTLDEVTSEWFKDKFYEFKERGFEEELGTWANHEEELEFVSRVLEKLYEIPSEEQQESNAKKEPDENDSTEDEEGDEDSEEKAPSEKYGKIPWEEIELGLGSEHENFQKPSDDCIPSAGSGVDYEDFDPSMSRRTPYSEVELKEVDLSTKGLNGIGSIISVRSQINYYTPYYNAMPEVTVGSRVRQYLQAKSATKRVRNKQRGRLETRKLVKTRLNVPEYEKTKIFSRTKDGLTLSGTKVYILCDSSGSMLDEHKWVMSAHSGLAISKCLSALHIEHELACFTEVLNHEGTNTHPINYIVKPFGRSVSPDHIRDCMLGMRAENNADGESLLIAGRKLLKQKADRRIMFVLSDGMPAAYRGGGAKLLTEVIKELTDRNVEIYSVGIEDESVKHFYKNYIVVENASQLEVQLLEMLKQTLIK